MSYNVVTEVGVMIVPANRNAGNKLAAWAQRNIQKAQELGDVSAMSISLPNGRIVVYTVDLRDVPEAFECSFYAANPEAQKAGELPRGLEWLREMTLENPPNEG